MDLNDYGACFCALYVTKDGLDDKIKLRSIPDRREKMRLKKEEETNKNFENSKNQSEKSLCTFKYPVWRCKVCGYLCSREKPPDTCPICKVDEKRFEKFLYL